MTHFAPTPRRLKVAATLVAGLGLLLAVPWQLTARATEAPILQEKNALANGGFEEGTDGWEQGSLPPDTNTPVSIGIDGDSHHGGKSSLRFAKTEASFFPVALMRQDVPTGKGKYLKISMWAKAQGVHKFVMAVGQNRAFAIYIGDRVGPNGSISHDWQQYTSSVPVGGASSVPISLEMYGAGTIWVDDVVATFTDSADVGSPSDETALADVKDVSNEDLQVAGDPLMRYFLIGAKSAEPAAGHKLIIVMPGGDGSKNFNPFIRRIWKNALPPGYIIAELVAPKWSGDQFATIVWPTRKARWQGMKFATEDFIEKVIKDVGRKHKVDPAHVYTLSWSSGGPAAYAASLGIPAIKGSFVAMSVFHPDELPALFNAKGHAYYLYQSPEDQTTRFSQAQLADKELQKAGAKTILESYEGGHGWHGNMYGDIRKGIEWLEKNSTP